MQGHTNLYKAQVIKSHQDPPNLQPFRHWCPECLWNRCQPRTHHKLQPWPYTLLGSLPTSEILVCPLTKQSMLGNWQCAAVQKASTSITLFLFPKMYHSQDTYLDEQKIQLTVFYIIVQRLCCSSAPGVWFGCENLLDSDALALNSFASRPYCKKPNPTSQPARFSCTRIFPR